MPIKTFMFGHPGSNEPSFCIVVRAGIGFNYSSPNDINYDTIEQYQLVEMLCFNLKDQIGRELREILSYKIGTYKGDYLIITSWFYKKSNDNQLVAYNMFLSDVLEIIDSLQENDFDLYCE